MTAQDYIARAAVAAKAVMAVEDALRDLYDVEAHMETMDLTLNDSNTYKRSDVWDLEDAKDALHRIMGSCTVSATVLARTWE